MYLDIMIGGMIPIEEITDSGFNGHTTIIPSLNETINDFTLEKTPWGRITFTDEINISRFNKNQNLLDYSRINHKKISIDTTLLPELANKKANLKFNLIDLNNPQIKYNGAECPETVCTNIAYDSSTKTFVANVNRFSTFTIEEGAYCGDGVCHADIDEDCETCVDDCGCTSGYVCVDGVCESDDDGGGNDGGNGGGGNPYVLCVTSWNCTWTSCSGGSQTYNCVDLNKCGTTKGRPSEHGTTRNCEVEKDCIDNDRDGYGEGEDCAGPDIDDTDPSITDTLTSEDAGNQDTQKNPFKSNLFYIILALLVLAGIIAAFIVILVIINSSKNPGKRSDIKISESKRKAKADF
jgi:hypothetical protein